MAWRKLNVDESPGDQNMRYAEESLKRLKTIRADAQGSDIQQAPTRSSSDLGARQAQRSDIQRAPTR